MVDPRRLDIIVKFEGTKVLRHSINVDESGQGNTQPSPNAVLSYRQKLALTLSGAMVMVFLVLMMFVAT